jgi:hypothetical protein
MNNCVLLGNVPFKDFTDPKLNVSFRSSVTYNVFGVDFNVLTTKFIREHTTMWTDKNVLSPLFNRFLGERDMEVSSTRHLIMPPFTVYQPHSDPCKEVERKGLGSINVVFGGKRSKMRWFNVRDWSKIKNVELDIHGQSFSGGFCTDRDALDLIQEQEILSGTAAIIRSNVFHDVINYDEHRRTYNMYIKCTKLKRRLKFDEIVERMGMY